MADVMLEAGAHGPDEYYDKFFVAKPKDVDHRELVTTEHGVTNAWVFADETRLNGPGREFIFVLRPEAGDLAAREALRVYADLVEDTYPGLAQDIRDHMDEIDSRLGDQGVK